MDLLNSSTSAKVRSGEHLNICIIGAGFSGICTGIQLQNQLNQNSYTIFDEHDDVGGTWLANTYPGCACDVPSHVYSYSFELNPYWSKAYSGQQEIWDYIRTVAKKYDIYSKVKFRHRVTSVRWDQEIGKWHVITLSIKGGQTVTHLFDIVVSCTGGLRVPNIPKEFEKFKGLKIHSAEWDNSIDLRDKVVAIVGSGASAVQIVPKIVDKVKRLISYQRNPPWVIPKLQYEYPNYVQWTFANVPGVQRLFRQFLFLAYDMNFRMLKVGSFIRKFWISTATNHLTREIEDPQLRAKLTPQYELGCRRIAPSNNYYSALARNNAEVVTCKIASVTEQTITTEDGRQESPDVLILATGYKIQDFFAPLNITGKAGLNLSNQWALEGPRTYCGIVSHHTPNLFFILGPNTATGHNSVLFPIECQVNWTIQVVKEMLKRNSSVIEVIKSVEDEYMESVKANMKSTVWGTSNCGSWYFNDHGMNTIVWPNTLIAYYNLTKQVNFSHFNFS